MTNNEYIILGVVIVYFLIRVAHVLYLTLHNYKTILVKYQDERVPELREIAIGDWIDIASPDLIKYKKGDTVSVNFGVAMELPSGYEAHIAPRSSTFQNTGLILTNGVGVIDNSYCGDNDFWGAKFYATRDGFIDRGQRICQFRIMKNQPDIHFQTVKTLGNEDRGGYGKGTGK